MGDKGGRVALWREGRGVEDNTGERMKAGGDRGAVWQGEEVGTRGVHGKARKQT